MAQTTVTSSAGWSPDVSAFAADSVVPDALILKHSTIAGAVDGDAPACRVTYVEDDEAAIVAEGLVIDEAEPVLAEATVHTAKVAQLVRLSAEQWRQENTAERLAVSVQRAVTKAADKAFIAQAAPEAPALAPAPGLLNTPGIHDAGAVGSDLDALVDAVAALEDAGATPGGILLAPSAWASLRKMKVSDGAATTLLGAGTEDAAPRLLSLPVTVTNALPTGAGLIIDPAAIVSAVGQVQVATSEHAYFGADSVAVRCTWRTGHAVMRPERLAKFSIS